MNRDKMKIKREEVLAKIWLGVYIEHASRTEQSRRALADAAAASFREAASPMVVTKIEPPTLEHVRGPTE